MIVESADGQRAAGRSSCIGYAAFVERMDQPSFVPWIAHLRERIEDLTDADVARLAEVQNELIDLVDQLDPDRVRFATNREKLQVPSADV